MAYLLVKAVVDNMSTLICIVLLLIGAIDDLKTKTISIWIPVSGIIAGIVLFFFAENREDIIGGCVLGLFMLGTSFVVKDFGMGDGVMILMTGVLKGMNICLESLMISFFIASISGCIIYLLKKEREKLFLPFIPFLLIGVLCIEVANIVELH